jgi:hypothetical protein
MDGQTTTYSSAKPRQPWRPWLSSCASTCKTASDNTTSAASNQIGRRTHPTINRQRFMVVISRIHPLRRAF